MIALLIGTWLHGGDGARPVFKNLEPLSALLVLLITSNVPHDGAVGAPALHGYGPPNGQYGRVHLD